MSEFAFLFPMEGDVLLSGADGIEKAGLLYVPVTLSGLPGKKVAINGNQAKWEEDVYLAQVPIGPGPQTLTATADGEGVCQVRVWWLKDGQKRLHITVDDCIRCFQDLTLHTEEYPSMLDHPYLALFHEAYQKYGMGVHINVFYENEDGSFNLSMMTDRYREEFQANAHWLSLSFHSIREFPDAPYQNADYDTVTRDCRLVTEEIRRFAGDNVLRETTTLHWGASNLEGARALRDQGFRALCGYLMLDEQGQPLVSYYLSKNQVERAFHREAMVDFEEDIFFMHLDFVLDLPKNAADQMEQRLNEITQRPNEGQFISIVIHEQYFYPDYHNYRSDYSDRVLTVARWAYEHGYKSVSLTELLRENRKG